MAAPVYTHTTQSFTTAGNRNGSKGVLTRAQKKLRSRTRDSANFTTAERLFGGVNPLNPFADNINTWPAHGASFRTTYADNNSDSKPDLIKKSTNVAGKSSNVFRTHGVS